MPGPTIVDFIGALGQGGSAFLDEREAIRQRLLQKEQMDLERQRVEQMIDLANKEEDRKAQEHAAMFNQSITLPGSTYSPEGPTPGVRVSPWALRHEFGPMQEYQQNVNTLQGQDRQSALFQTPVDIPGYGEHPLESVPMYEPLLRYKADMASANSRGIGGSSDLTRPATIAASIRQDYGDLLPVELQVMKAQVRASKDPVDVARVPLNGMMGGDVELLPVEMAHARVQAMTKALNRAKSAYGTDPDWPSIEAGYQMELAQAQIELNTLAAQKTLAPPAAPKDDMNWFGHMIGLHSAGQPTQLPGTTPPQAAALGINTSSMTPDQQARAQTLYNKYAPRR
jgi:hypothetical protein